MVHGCVDGFSRTASLCFNLFPALASYKASKLQIMGIHANTNNRASTVLEMFLDAIVDYGIPSCVHGNCGGKNKDVAVLIILL